MNRSDIRRVLEDTGVRPSRQLGQNFLTDEDVARNIANAIDPQPEDCVIEVGPGTGALTRHLVGRVRRLVLVEFDARLAEHLRDEMRGRDGVEVIFADAARFDLRPFYREGPIKFIGNLPYSAGGAILKNFFTRPTPVSIGVVMLQKEFIDRMLAEPGGKDYGVLSVRLQSEWKMSRFFDVPPTAFNPRPKIDSTVAMLSPLPERAFPSFDARLLDTLLRRGFGQRRKQLHKQLPDGTRPWSEIAAHLDVPATVRAEQLSVAQWINLTRELDPHPLMDLPQKDDEIFDVVDQNDQVIGRERRADVHARDLLHRAVHVFVWNKYGEIFLQKRSRLKDKHPGVWDSSASGHLDSGEDYDACAIRELEEELGITGANARRVAYIHACPNTGWEFVRLYHTDWNGNPKFPCAEIESGLWIHPRDLEPWLQDRPQDFASGFLECWSRYKDNENH
ncbi:MAG: 16S rRNA (adenine(1518)-N(6)/adenine(1519)-N(6))-dimethyltransferase RsmA [Verrucomicrobiales bacterium]